MLVLRPRDCVEVDYGKNPVSGAGSYGAVKVAKTIFLYYERVGIIFQVPVIQRDPDRVDADGGEESGVLVPEEV